jgi:hypothetical protein
MTTLETCETTQPPAGQQLNGRVALVNGGARGSARRLVARSLAGWGGATGWHAWWISCTRPPAR